jgi:hypothetical protein
MARTEATAEPVFTLLPTMRAHVVDRRSCTDFWIDQEFLIEAGNACSRRRRMHGTLDNRRVDWLLAPTAARDALNVSPRCVRVLSSRGDVLFAAGKHTRTYNLLCMEEILP